MHDELERLVDENRRLRVERDRLFGLVVGEEEITRPRRGLSQTEAITRVLRWMKTLPQPNPTGEIAQALTEHDRLSASDRSRATQSGQTPVYHGAKVYQGCATLS